MITSESLNKSVINRLKEILPNTLPVEKMNIYSIKGAAEKHCSPEQTIRVFKLCEILTDRTIEGLFETKTEVETAVAFTKKTIEEIYNSSNAIPHKEIPETYGGSMYITNYGSKTTIIDLAKQLKDALDTLQPMIDAGDIRTYRTEWRLNYGLTITFSGDAEAYNRLKIKKAKEYEKTLETHSRRLRNNTKRIEELQAYIESI